MWIFMVLMMVVPLTRKRAQADCPILDGSPIVKKPARKHSTRLSKTTPSVSIEAPISRTIIAEDPLVGEASNVESAPIEEPNNGPVAPVQPNIQEVAGQPPEESIKERKKRKQNTNKKLIKTLEGLPNGTKVSLEMAKGTKAFVGPSATKFATECGIIIRNVCSMEYHRWDSIPQDHKTLMYEKLQGKFELLRTDLKFMDYVDARLREHWKRYRGELSRHWKSVGGKDNPELARKKIKPGCRADNWNHMCKYWELEKTRNYSDKMEDNRQKKVNISRGGSRSIANLVHSMTNTETQTPPSPLKVYYELHYKEPKDGNGDGWLNDDARNEYENICNHKQTALDKLKDEGTLITTVMEHEIERQAIKSVCGRKKTIQSGWEVGVGLVLRKKDYWMKELPESSQQADSMSEQKLAEMEELRKKVSEHERNIRKYEKMEKFMREKFPDFEVDGNDDEFTDSDI